VRDASLAYGRRAVFKGLSFALRDEESLYVCGPSGSGKTALIKALCGLVELESGQIAAMPNANLVMVLCQSPLMVHKGTMAEQIVYPKTELPQDFREISDLLAKVGLAHLRPEQGGVEQLSRADVQRLCLARVLHHRPVLALLDDALTGLPEAERERACDLLRESRVAFVSTGSDPDAAKHHTHVVHLTNGEQSEEEEE